MLIPPPVPAGVLVQVLNVDAEGVEAGYRIYADGRYESRPAGKSWSQGERLSAARLERARAAIADAGLPALPAVTRLEGVRGDGRVLWAQSPEASVAVVGPARQPALEALSARLVAIFKEDV
jgi:hypothetical protein